MRADAFERVRCGVRGMTAEAAADLLDFAADIAAEEIGRNAFRSNTTAEGARITRRADARSSWRVSTVDTPAISH